MIKGNLSSWSHPLALFQCVEIRVIFSFLFADFDLHSFPSPQTHTVTSRDLSFHPLYNKVYHTDLKLSQNVLVDCNLDLFIIYLLDAVSGHDINDSTTYHSKPYKPICLNTEPSVEGLRVGIPKVIYCVSCQTSVSSLQCLISPLG